MVDSTELEVLADLMQDVPSFMDSAFTPTSPFDFPDASVPSTSSCQSSSDIPDLANFMTHVPHFQILDESSSVLISETRLPGVCDAIPNFSIPSSGTPSPALTRPAETRPPGTLTTETRPPGTLTTETRPPGTLITETRPPGTLTTETRPPGTLTTETRPLGVLTTESRRPSTITAEVRQPATMAADTRPPGTLTTEARPTRGRGRARSSRSANTTASPGFFSDSGVNTLAYCFL